jgi:hypothetical protein
MRAPELHLAGWGFVLNGVWELLHTPLYADAGRAFTYLLWTRLHCTLGDVLILLGAFWATSLLARSRFWWMSWRPAMVVTFVVLGFGYTVFSEWTHTRLWGGWEYGPGMPRVFGLGLTPLLQWLALPPVALWLLAQRAPVRPDGECARSERPG